MFEINCKECLGKTQKIFSMMNEGFAKTPQVNWSILLLLRQNRSRLLNNDVYAYDRAKKLETLQKGMIFYEFM